MRPPQSPRHPHCCIVPPYLLDAILRHGTPPQRAAALATQGVDSTFRAVRLATQASRFAPTPRGAPVPLTQPTPQRTIYSAQQSYALPGTVVRREGQAPTGDPAVDEAYDGLGATVDFFAQIFERDSIDDAGMPLPATVHYGQHYANAFWDGMRMVFGDGDGELFQRFTLAVDVIAHELAHGVTDDESQLWYSKQAGALHESLSDVCGSLVKQWVLQQTADQADWLIGAGLFTAQVHGVALRSMRAPGTAYDDPILGTDPQPSHMRDLVHTAADNGGVHINSGIPNHAFFQVAMALGGYAWEEAGQIWYDTLRDARLKPNASFKRFAQLTADVAGRRYGRTSPQRAAVRAGWEAVGLRV